MTFNEYISAHGGAANKKLNERADLDFHRRFIDNENEIIATFKEDGHYKWGDVRHSVSAFFSAADQLSQAADVLKRAEKDLKKFDKIFGSEWTAGTGADTILEDVTKMIKKIDRLIYGADKVAIRFGA